MDSHDIKHLALAALGAAAIGYTQLPSRASPEAWPTPIFTPGELGHHHWVIYAQPGSGALPAALKADIDADNVGQKPTRSLLMASIDSLKTIAEAKLEPATNSFVGIWMAPNTPEVRTMADALGTSLGVKIVVDNFELGEMAYGTPYQIGIGSRPK